MNDRHCKAIVMAILSVGDSIYCALTKAPMDGNAKLSENADAILDWAFIEFPPREPAAQDKGQGSD